MGRNSARRVYKIPGRWQPYTPLGDPIAGTRFISFKVPLKEDYNCNLSSVERFTPKDLIAQVSEKGHELGLIIDFTFTDRYYDGKEITDAGIEYEKIKTVGHNIPDREIIERFTSVVQRFLEQNADNEKLIGVHCTHGVNRTGYIVCRYMIDHLGCEPDTAIEAFNKARGHNLERENYLCELRGGTAEEIAEIERQMEEQHLKEMKPNRTPKRIRKTPPPPSDKKKRAPRMGRQEGSNDRKQANGMRGLDRGSQGRGKHGKPWGHAAYDRRGAWDYQGSNAPDWRNRAPRHDFGNPGPGFGRPGPMYDNPGPGWGNQGSGFGNPGPGWGNQGPVCGNQGPGWGDQGPGWGDQGPGWGNQGAGWGYTNQGCSNQGPGWGNQRGGLGYANQGWGNDVEYVDSDHDKIKEAMLKGFDMGVKTALTNSLSRSRESLPGSHDGRVQSGRRRSGEVRW